jgi:hypothetical protein
MTILTNAFSINMLSENAQVNFYKVDVRAAQSALIDTADMVKNVIGHPDTDYIVRKELENDYGSGTPWLSAGTRETVAVKNGDILVIAQYKGNRLPEGCKKLPEGSTIEYWIATIQ